MGLRIGLVGVVRPLFKGDGTGVFERSRAALAGWGQRDDFELVVPSVLVQDPPSSELAARELSDSSLDFLLIQHSTFATGDLLSPLLRSAARVGVWAVGESFRGVPTRTGPVPLNSLCGLNMTMSLADLAREGMARQVKWFYGDPDTGWFRERFETTLSALRGLQAVETARILHVGGTAPGFYGIAGRPTFPSVTVDDVSLDDVIRRVQELPESAAEEEARRWLDEEPVLEAPAEHLQRVSRVKLVLEKLAREGNYDGLALRCWPEFPERCGVVVCACVGRLADVAIPTSCEGDVLGTLSMLAMQGLSQDSPALMDLTDFDSGDGAVLFWHCGNTARNWASTAGTRLTRHFNRDTMGVVRDMVMRPGPATGLRFLEGGSKALVFSGVFGESGRPGFDGVRGWLGDLRWNGEPLDGKTFLSNLLDYRVPHHYAFGTGERTEAVAEMCDWLDSAPLPLHPARNSL